MVRWACGKIRAGVIIIFSESAADIVIDNIISYRYDPFITYLTDNAFSSLTGRNNNDKKPKNDDDYIDGLRPILMILVIVPHFKLYSNERYWFIAMKIWYSFSYARALQCGTRRLYAPWFHTCCWTVYRLLSFPFRPSVDSNIM